MALVDAIAEADVDPLFGDTDYTPPAPNVRAVLARYAAKARNYPLLSHAALVERSRTVYTHHYSRLCCLSQLPAIIEMLVALNTRRQKRDIRWTSFVCSVGDHSPAAKDAILDSHRLSQLPLPKNGIPDTSVSREDKVVIETLDDLQLLYEAFLELPLEQRLYSDSSHNDAMARVARRIELRWDAVYPMLARFIEVTDAFIAAKRAVIAAAARRPVDSTEVHELSDRFLLTSGDQLVELQSLAGDNGDPADFAQRLAQPLAELRALEATHSRSCELVLELRRHYDIADHAMRQSINDIVLRNLLLVVKEVSKSRISGEELLDAIQEGNDGLAEGALRFRYWTGTRFSTYATYWIHHRLHRLRSTTRAQFTIPASIVQRNVEISKTRARLALANDGRVPSAREIAAELGIDVAKVLDVEAAYAWHHSEEALRDLADDQPQQEETVAQDQLADLVRQAIAALPARHAELARMRFGIDQEPLNQYEIAKRCKLSQERVRRLELECLQRLMSGRFARQLRLFLT
jgi:RNA polymerase primary sigma factor